MSDAIARREFIAASMGSIAVSRGAHAAPAETDWRALPPVTVRVIYLGLGGAWPKPEFDAPAEAAKFRRYLEGAGQRLADVRFVGHDLIANRPAEAAKLAATLGDEDAILLVHLAFGSSAPMRAFVETGRPVAIFSQPFSGHDWMYIPQWQREGRKVILIPSSDYADLERAAALLRVPVRMRQSRILLIGKVSGTAAAQSAEQVKARTGATVVTVTVPELVEAHAAVDPKAAEREAEEEWIRPAKKIVEPSRAEIVKSARTYLALKALMIRERAQAVTIACLGGMPIETIGYPCFAFSKLCDLGLVGACEADMDSTLTMLMFAYAFRKPGFITDPLFDVAKNAVVHAHCLAPTRMDGPGSPRAPFVIRTHRDNNRGASLQVQLRVGQEITCAKLVNLETILLSAGQIVEIPDFDDRGCRTQIVTRVAHAREMFRNWGSGVVQGNMMTLLHRVVFYGNHVEDVKDLAVLMGQKVLMEG